MEKKYLRLAERQLREALEDTPVVMIHGPRQCGKTTLAQQMSTREEGYEYLTLDDEAVRTAAELDPMGFCLRLPPKAIIDEAQRVPRLFTAIKYIIDQERAPGRLILTGSSDVMSLPQVSDSLAGRVEVIRLHPLARAELRGEREDELLIQRLYEGHLSELTSRSYERLGAGLSELIVRGSFPAALARPHERRARRWYTAYAQALVQRDIHDLAHIRKAEAVPKLLEACALMSAQTLNLASLSSALSLTQATLKEYLSLLQQLFLIDELPAYHNNHLKRLTKTPKLHLVDTGLACAVMGLTSQALERDRARLGHLVETWVFQELTRQVSWLDDPLSLSHYRTKDQLEVDVVIESPRGVMAVEVKTSASLTFADFKGLAQLRDQLGGGWLGGVLLYDGERVVSSGDGLWAVPLSAL